MKLLYRVIILFMVGYFVFSLSAFADRIDGLQEIYNTSIPAEIRRNFNEYIHVRETCPESMGGVIDGEQFLDIYKKKFLVVGISSNGFGGVWATIVVKDVPLRAFRLWLYEVDTNVYDLRSVAKLTGSFDKEGMDVLCSPSYKSFWL